MIIRKAIYAAPLFNLVARCWDDFCSRNTYKRLACFYLLLRFHHTLLSVQRQFLIAVTRFFKGASYSVSVVAGIGGGISGYGGGSGSGTAVKEV